MMELGLYSFAPLRPDLSTGRAISPEQRLRDLMEEIELADAVGLDVFGIGEHHRPDFAVSAPAVVLAAAAMRSRTIRLTSAVSMLGSDDPVRVFQEFATLDLLSGGRAEIMVGRGAFTESFPLFGHDLADFDSLFASKLDLLVKVRDSERVNWSGLHRPAIDGLGVYPRPVQQPLPIWAAVGSTPQSAIRAATMGLPMALAAFSGELERFKGLVDLYRQTGADAGHVNMPVGINAHAYVAETAEDAAAEFFPVYADAMTALGRDRGWPPMTRERFDALRAPGGALVVGSPQQVVDKILRQFEMFGHQRFLSQMSMGALPHELALKSIELFATRVAPEVRRATGVSTTL